MGVALGNYSPPKLLLAKLFAASELAAYSGYASTRKVKMPLKTKSVLQVPKRLATVFLCDDTCS